MKVLMIGQLPKEVGGNYTTGAANVVYELSKKKVDNLSVSIYGTNIKSSQARKYCQYPNQYLGYSYRIIEVILLFLLHPKRAIKQWNHFKNIDHENPWRYFFYEVNIKEAIKKVQPDIIHVHSIGNISSTKFALNGKKIPIVLTCHGIFYRGEENDVIGRDKYMGNIKMADAYTGLTMESTDEYEKFLGISKDSVSVVPNGVDCGKFYFDEKKRVEIRKEMGVADDTKVLITVASVQERKGQLAFVNLLKEIDLNWQYWIIGTGPDVPAIERYIEENELKEKVRLLGYHTANELYGYYSAADIYAHVSTKEGQALCEIEANATGLRTILNKKIEGTIPDIKLGDYYVYDPDNVNIEEMKNWMQKEPSTRSSKTSLDWSSIMERYYKVYNQILPK